MSIVFDPERSTLTLSTRNTTYQMQIGPLGYLLHLYYGRRAEGCFDYLYLPADRGFSPNPYELREQRGWSLDTLPQEYSGANCGDFRLSALNLSTEAGVRGADLRYAGHRVLPGKYAVPGLPAAFDRGGEAETLSVTLADSVAGIEVELLYGVFEAQDVITRAARIVNTGDREVRLEKAASLCLDVPFGAWDAIHFHGRHTMERVEERAPLSHGIQTVSSRRGISGHQHNPFVILCARSATEDSGDCYGLMLAYSGSHRTDVELDQAGSVRIVTGIHDEEFSWALEPGERFDTPEALLAFSHEGLARLSHIYHGFLRRNICRSKFVSAAPPVLLNSWEAAYYDFDAGKILRIADRARALGMDMLVLDDGWFGKRDSDNRALGDWFANESKLPGGLGPVISGVRAMGLKFGLWIEPEMVSEDSELYRAHPDWALTVPGRRPVMGRHQLVLDLSRSDVADWLYETVAGLLRRDPIEYIKWDCNRGLTDLYSRLLPADRQGEVAHRYMLGLYSVLERLTAEFPDVLFEGCAGGGGRFDAGMLAYFPQIWCSDNTDAVERLAIQRGTSFGYPVSAIGAHVSASPNHQTGRRVPLDTRAIVAMSGTFGYELDPEKLSEEEAERVRAQIARFRAYSGLIRNGDYFRLGGPEQNGRFAAWQFVAGDGGETLVNLVVTHVAANAEPIRLRLKGLLPEARYALARADFCGCAGTPEIRETENRDFSGAALMYGGYVLPAMLGDWPGVQLLFRRQ